jgi:hypothetical protein
MLQDGTVKIGEWQAGKRTHWLNEGVTAGNNSSNRLILTQFIKVEMLKYTIFKSKIIYKGEEGVGLTLKAWNE